MSTDKPTRQYPLGEREVVRDDGQTPDLPDEPLPPPTRRPRVTVTGSVVHQLPGEQAKSAPRSRFFRWLDRDEAPYERTVKVGRDWQPLDLGWVGDDCSLLILANSTKLVTSVRPPQSEIDALYSKVLEVGVIVGMRADGSDRIQELFEIPVGEDCRIPSPRGAAAYRVRSTNGEAKYSIFAVPG